MECTCGGGTNGRKGQIASLIEQRSAESHGIRAGKNDEVEGFECPEPAPEVLRELPLSVHQ